METASSANYIPLLMQIGVAAGFVIFTLFVTHKLTPRINSERKDDNFECGIEAQGNARFPVVTSNAALYAKFHFGFWRRRLDRLQETIVF